MLRYTWTGDELVEDRRGIWVCYDEVVDELRNRFACAALTGLITNYHAHEIEDRPRPIARAAFHMAEAMMLERTSITTHATTGKRCLRCNQKTVEDIHVCYRCGHREDGDFRTLSRTPIDKEPTHKTRSPRRST